MKKDSKLLIIEKVMDSENISWRNLFGDMKMQVLLGGELRTQDDFKKIIGSSGFKVSKIIPTQSAFSIIEGIKN